jgi:hypothetical protein
MWVKFFQNTFQMVYASLMHTTLPGIKKLSQMTHNANVLTVRAPGLDAGTEN